MSGHETLEVWRTYIGKTGPDDKGWRWEAKCGHCDWRRVFGWKGGYRRALAASLAHEAITAAQPSEHLRQTQGGQGPRRPPPGPAR